MKNYIAFYFIFIFTSIAGPIKFRNTSCYGDLCFGQIDAPITIYEYASLTCDHCAEFYQHVFPQLMKKYIQSGRVRFVFRHFVADQAAFLGAAALLYCPYPARPRLLKTLFQSQGQWMEQPLEGISKITKVPKNNLQKTLTDDFIMKKILGPGFALSHIFSINATPVFFINGKEYIGAMSFERLEEIISRLL